MNYTARVYSDHMLALCERVATLYRNPSPSQAATCREADRAGRPAFWTATGWDSMTIQHVAWLATAGGELHVALERFCTPDMDPPRKEIIDNLIPLNHNAILQLRMAYGSLNLYPTIPSLHARTEKRS